MALKGTANTLLPSTSVIKFLVKDSVAILKSAAIVNFQLTTSVGGITIEPSSASTDSNGYVQVTVSSGKRCYPCES